MKKATKAVLSFIFALCTVGLAVACASAPDDIYEAKQCLDSYGYEFDLVNYYIDSDVSNEFIGDYEQLSGNRYYTHDEFYAYLFTESADARIFYQDLKEDMETESGKFGFNGRFWGFDVKKKGKWVVVGTSDAVEEFFSSESSCDLGSLGCL